MWWSAGVCLAWSVLTSKWIRSVYRALRHEARTRDDLGPTQPLVEAKKAAAINLLSLVPIGANQCIPGTDWFYYALQVSNTYTKRAISASGLTVRLSFRGHERSFEVERALFVKRDPSGPRGMQFSSKISLDQNDCSEIIVFVGNKTDTEFCTMRSFPILTEQEDALGFEECACDATLMADGGIREEGHFLISIQRNRKPQISAI